MFSFKKTLSILLAAALLIGVTACSDDDDNASKGDYAVAISVFTGPGNYDYSYYVVAAEDLMTGTITPVANGVEQIGYIDYASANGKIVSFGGQGEQAIKSVTQGTDGTLLLSGGKSVFDRPINNVVQADNNTLLAASFPKDSTVGTNISYYTLDIESNSITKSIVQPAPQLSKLEWSNFSGMAVNGGKAFVSFYLNNIKTYATQYTDTAYVGVYTYPAMTLDKVIKDVRTGPVGGFNTLCGLIKTDNGDIYAVSATNKANGFSQKTKPGGILKIANGKTEFDKDYFFAIEGISHIMYIGNNLALAEVVNKSFAEQTAWTDAPIKTVIIDLVSKKVTDVTGVPTHVGNGGRSFPALVYDGKAYMTVVVDGVTYIYRIDPTTATATQGAQVVGTFVAGLFHF